MRTLSTREGGGSAARCRRSEPRSSREEEGGEGAGHVIEAVKITVKAEDGAEDEGDGKETGEAGEGEGAPPRRGCTVLHARNH